MKSPVFDKEGALNRVGGDRELLAELIQLFIDEYNDQVDELLTFIQDSNAKELERRAHSIKSALGNIGAMQGYDAAYELELAGKNAELGAGAELSFKKLKEGISAYLEASSEFIS